MAGPMRCAALCPLILIAACGPRPLDPAAKATLARWLGTSCTVKIEQQLEEDLKRHGAALEPYLIEAFRNGPPKERAERIVAVAGKQYEMVAKADRDGKEDEGGGEVRESGVTPFSRTWLVDRVRTNFEESYRIAALTGLGVTAGREGLKLLEEVAGDSKSPFRAEAAMILKERRK
jgi:hypothetical protein